MKKNIAILVACEEYDHGFDSLTGANTDLKKMAEAFEKYCGLKSEDIYRIYNSDNAFSRPGRQDILKAINDISERYTENGVDRLFFYYSGHGFQGQSNAELYLAPQDVVPGNLEYSSLEYKQICKILKDAFLPFNILCFLDACQAIPLSVSKNIRQEQSVDWENGDYLVGGVTLFASCMPGHHSYMIEKLRMSAFTYCLTMALSNKGGCVLVSELDIYLKKELPKICRDYGISEIQRPITSLDDTSQNKIRLVVKPMGAELDEYLEKICTPEELEDVKAFSDEIKKYTLERCYDYARSAQDKAKICLEKDAGQVLLNYEKVFEHANQLTETVCYHVEKFSRSIKRCEHKWLTRLLRKPCVNKRAIDKKCADQIDFIRSKVQESKKLFQSVSQCYEENKNLQKDIYEVQKIMFRYRKAAQLSMDIHDERTAVLEQRCEDISRTIKTIQEYYDRMQENTEALELLQMMMNTFESIGDSYCQKIRRLGHQPNNYKPVFFEKIDGLCEETQGELNRIRKKIEEG
ncbi:MAG: caspase family protein [Eubacteriales bacterium]|nr:caspase family protein [Eubacteriales bacterium]